MAPYNNFDERGRVGAPRLVGTKPSLPLASYLGTYRHPLYGDAEITLAAGTLSLSLMGLTTPLDHWQLDSFRTRWSTQFHRAVLPLVHFTIDARGDPQRLWFNPRLEFGRAQQ